MKVRWIFLSTYICMPESQGHDKTKYMCKGAHLPLRSYVSCSQHTCNFCVPASSTNCLIKSGTLQIWSHSKWLRTQSESGNASGQVHHLPVAHPFWVGWEAFLGRGGAMWDWNQRQLSPPVPDLCVGLQGPTRRPSSLCRLNSQAKYQASLLLQSSSCCKMQW